MGTKRIICGIILTVAGVTSILLGAGHWLNIETTIRTMELITAGFVMWGASTAIAMGNLVLVVGALLLIVGFHDWRAWRRGVFG